MEHKIYDFTREYEKFVKCAKLNLKLYESFNKATIDHDSKAADHLSNSPISKLQTVINILVNYLPHL